MSDPEAPRSPEMGPEPGLGTTVRIHGGEPEDPHGTQRLERTDPAMSASTQKIALDLGKAEQTLKMVIPPSPKWGNPADEPVVLKPPSLTESSSSQPPRNRSWMIPLLMGSLVVVGTAAYLVFSRGQGPQALTVGAKEARPEAIPEAAKLYLEQAQKGDAHAMRMLGVMYYYGLNVPQDRVKGLFWYRKAAEQGSDAARDELRKLESGS